VSICAKFCAMFGIADCISDCDKVPLLSLSACVQVARDCASVLPDCADE